MSNKYGLQPDRCPWCNVATPWLREIPVDKLEGGGFDWYIHQCSSCEQYVFGRVTGGWDGELEVACPPQKKSISKDIPSSVRRFLSQAVKITSQPDACIMACSSAIDAMLKEKNFVKGKLYKRIAKAVQKNIITEDMMAWADHVRLVSNDSRHADTKSVAPTTREAKQCSEFAMALAEILFVLPSRVSRGRKAAEKSIKPSK